jgi:hypothetical protein
MVRSYMHWCRDLFRWYAGNHLISRLYRCAGIALATLFFYSSSAHSQERITWNTIDLMPESRFSVFRYAALGLGAFPYIYSSPTVPLRVTYNGVPIRSASPFGPDIELVSTVFADSVIQTGWRTMAIVDSDSIPPEPVTETQFLTGSRRRFVMDAVLRRALDKRSGITIGGSSFGMKGFYPSGTETFIPKHNLRDYLFSYQRKLTNVGLLTMSVRGFRDRDGLADLDSLHSMGERRTDESVISIGIHDLQFSPTTSLSPQIYYQRTSSRFGRYGIRKSLDDDYLGFSISADKHLAETQYHVRLLHERNYFGSQFSGDVWTRHESALEVTMHTQRNRFSATVESALRHHSQYKAGFEFGSDLMYALPENRTLFMRAHIATVYPDNGDEYYTSLMFSDSTFVSDLDRGMTVNIESGIGFPVFGGLIEMLGFWSRSKAPLFVASGSTFRGGGAGTTGWTGSDTSAMIMADGLTSSGVHVIWNTSFGDDPRWTIRTVNSYRYDNDGSRWYYPAAESVTNGAVSRSFVNGNLHLKGYSRIDAAWWDDHQKTVTSYPSGSHLFLDAGFSLTAGTLELFYSVENIVSEDIYWFRMYKWQGRNTVYGGRWIFYQ